MLCIDTFTVCDYLDITECNQNTCSGNGECIEVVGGGTRCICNQGHTSANCSVGRF